MAFKEEFKKLLLAKTECIWIETYEEQKAMMDIIKVITESFAGTTLFSWSMFEGLRKEKLTRFETQEESKNFPPDKLFKQIISQQIDAENTGDKSVYLLKDMHAFQSNAQIVRGLRDIKNRRKEEMKIYTPIIVIAPVIDINPDLDKQFTIVQYETPTESEIERIMRAFIRKVEDNKGEVPSKSEIDKCIKLAKGLTFDEIKQFLTRSIIEHKTIKTEMFLEARKELIKKTGLLEYKEVNMDMSAMGGNEVFKEWISDVKLTFDDEAEAFGVEKSKGYLTIGPPGTAKTVSAEIVASELGLPIIKLDMSKIMHSHVGQSERNMSKAIEILKACKPCVLFIDEIEKTLSGNSSGMSDGGAMQRTFGLLLELLSNSDSDDIFTIMTSNDASQMPPELTRSGRLDTIWFFDLPNEEERKAIFNIHFAKRNIEINPDIINYGAMNSENFSGAEIQETVKVTLRNAFKRYKATGEKEIQIDDISEALNSIVKVYDYSREKILTLREYSKNRARFATAKSEETKKDNNISMLSISK